MPIGFSIEENSPLAYDVYLPRPQTLTRQFGKSQLAILNRFILLL